MQIQKDAEIDECELFYFQCKQNFENYQRVLFRVYMYIV